MREFINTVNTLGEDAVVTAIINKTITEFADDRITKVRDSAFYKCNALTSVDLPNVTTIGVDAFRECNALTSVDLPNVISIGQTAFRQCRVLVSVEMPNVTTIAANAFTECRALSSVYLSNVTSIEPSAFAMCGALTKVIIETPSVCHCGASVFSNTPIAYGTGYIYVPDGLVDSYKNASGWSTYAAQIKPLSELPSDA